MVGTYVVCNKIIIIANISLRDKSQLGISEIFNYVRIISFLFIHFNTQIRYFYEKSYMTKLI